jgi:guanosine-3',5'-bis(diphosphate) 3'-pyrophosphohydrolase
MDSSLFNLKFQKNRLLNDIGSLPKADKEKIVEACCLAQKYHSGQLRDEGGPYILHCLRVASYLIENLGVNNVGVICASLLHDAVEDTDLTLLEIRRKFGQRTAKLVGNLTRKKLPGETELNKYERKYQKFLETMQKDFYTRAIKASDWLDNMVSWPLLVTLRPVRKKFERWFREAEKMYMPLAQTVDLKLVEEMKKVLIEAKREYRKSKGF